MNEGYKKIFLVQSNTKLDFKKHFNELMEFQINRINRFYPDNCWLFDPCNLVQIHGMKYNKTLCSGEELKNWVTSLDTSDQIFLVDSVNPFLDIELIDNLSTKFKNNKSDTLKVHGAIPGTAPDLVVSRQFFLHNISKFNGFSEYDINTDKFYWDSQRKYNTQFDLNTTQRIKIFSKLIHKIESLFSYSLEDFIVKINEDEIFNLVLDFGIEELRTTEVYSCPYCNSSFLKPLYLTTSQTMMGFLSNEKPIYYECLDCSLVVLRKQCFPRDVKLLYDEYERAETNPELLIQNYKKYQGSHFFEKKKGLEIIEPLLPHDASIVDLGAGFGEFACFAKLRNPEWNVYCADFNLNTMKEMLTKNLVKSINVNFLEDDFGTNYDLITMWQAIEHLPFEKIYLFFEHVKNSLKNGGYFILSTPDYDSPIAKIFDYHMLYPPHHQTILSSSWLEKFVTENNLFRVIRRESACLLFESYDDWFSYYKKTSPNDQVRSMVKILDSIHKNPGLFKNFEEDIALNKMGSETILFLQK